MNAAEIEFFARVMGRQSMTPNSLAAFSTSAKSWVGDSTPYQSSGGTEVGDDAAHASHVIGVRVGDGDGIQAANTARP